MEHELFLPGSPGGCEEKKKLESSVNERRCEGAGRVGEGDEVVMVYGSSTAHGDPRPATTPSREQQSSYFWIFYEAVVHVTYVTVFLGVGRVVYPSWGTTPRNFHGRRSCTATCHNLGRRGDC